MNAKICLALALVAIAEVSQATFVVTTTGAAATGALTLSGGSAAALGLLGGIVLIKGIALGALALSAASRRRGRRSASDEDDAAFLVIANTEPAQCYRRLICDMATGTMPKSDNDVIMSLFNGEVDIVSPKFEYSTAAKLGKQIKNIQVCELRYSCPLSGSDIQKLFN